MKIKSQIKKLNERQIFGHDDLVIMFGSRKVNSDIDLLVVSPRVNRYQQFQLGIFDITSLSPSLAFYYARNYDPIVCDPILNGMVINKNKKIKNEISEALVNHNSVEDIILHHLLQSMRCRLIAQSNYDLYLNNTCSRELILDFMKNLAWACSYYISSITYHSKGCKKVILYKEHLKSAYGDILLLIRNEQTKFQEQHDMKCKTNLKYLMTMFDNVLLKTAPL